MIGNAALESDSIADVSGNSVVLTVGNTGTATNGQAKITAISLKYKANQFFHTISSRGPEQLPGPRFCITKIHLNVFLCQ